MGFPDDVVIVTGGAFLSGALVPHAPERSLVTLPDFAITRDLISCAKYLDFLNALARKDLGEAMSRTPRLEEDAPSYFPYDSDKGAFFIPTEDKDGDAWDPLWPINMVTYDDACAYAAWRAKIDGVPWRLPTSEEWEKAARGVDGRLYPWGNEFDASFCNTREARRGRPMPSPVGTFPEDVSPYGVRDAAGNVIEWTSSWTSAAQDTKVMRGASYASMGIMTRLDSSWSALTSIRYPSYGFRLVFSLER